MEVVLAPDLVEQLAKAVAEGRFASAEVAVSEALRLLLNAQPGDISWVDEAIGIGIDQADRGDVLAGELVRAEFSAHWRSRSGQ